MKQSISMNYSFNSKVSKFIHFTFKMMIYNIFVDFGQILPNPKDSFPM